MNLNFYLSTESRGMLGAWAEDDSAEGHEERGTQLELLKDRGAARLGTRASIARP